MDTHRAINMRQRLINNHTTILLIAISAAFLWGILSFEHVYPGDRDFNLGALQLIMISMGLTVYLFLYKKTCIYLSFMSLFWLVFSAYLLIQSLFIDFDYIDSVYLVIGVSLFFFILSVVVTNLSHDDKQYLVDGIANVLIIGCLLSLLTQFGHLYQLAFLYGDLLLPIEYNGRPVGNIGQPNQLAYIYSLGVLANIYKASQIDKAQSRWAYLWLGCQLIVLILLALGIALTASRGGIILLLTAIILSSVLFYNATFTRLKALSVFTVASIVGFLVGNYLLSVHSQTVSAATRIISGESQPFRVYQLEQSWIIFQQHPILGIGWGKYSEGVLDNALKLPWFIYNSHSHMIFSQIAAELGIIGLIILVIFLFLVIPRRVLNLSHAYQKIALACVLITLLYSLSEYPLWYFVYLSLFVVCFSSIDFRLLVIDFSSAKKYTTVLILLVMSIYAFLGYKVYMKYSDVTTQMLSSNNLTSIQNNINEELPLFFGLSKHRDKLLYAMAGEDANNIEAKIELGNKVLKKENSFYFLVKQANYYDSVGNGSQALHLYKKACVYNFAERCNDVENRIKQYNGKSSIMLLTFRLWRQENPKKTAL